ncbi:hypothetical protein F4803DRAFT_532867 [Xylaria telfairii]|nr:hypothetical protein F4803DRAFT_532867 [Xylaria telfairii]
MLLSILTTSAIFLATAFASPLSAIAASSDGKHPLAKRGNGLHMVNCKTYSVVVYCADDSNCNFYPGPGNQCIPKDHLNTKGLEVWETNGSCRFDTGVIFSWNIQSNAQLIPNYGVVGSATNSFQGFTVRKDDQHVMYTDGHNNPCISIYYAV